VQQLFFNCCVAVDVWNIISQILDVQIGSGFEPVAKWWNSNKKHGMRNVCYADILWSLWKTRALMW
jgi:methionine salvage enolase-phosphatase E1